MQGPARGRRCALYHCRARANVSALLLAIALVPLEPPLSPDPGLPSVRSGRSSNRDTDVVVFAPFAARSAEIPRGSCGFTKFQAARKPRHFCRGLPNGPNYTFTRHARKRRLNRKYFGCGARSKTVIRMSCSNPWHGPSYVFAGTTPATRVQVYL